jgi:transcriptional regulator with XRE-family HTH domain
LVCPEPGPRLPLVHGDFNNRALEEALKELAEQAEMSVVLDIRVKEKAKIPVTARFLNTPLDTAVRFLADMAGLKSLQVDNLLYVTSPENAEKIEKIEEEPSKQMLKEMAKGFGAPPVGSSGGMDIPGGGIFQRRLGNGPGQPMTGSQGPPGTQD